MPELTIPVVDLYVARLRRVRDARDVDRLAARRDEVRDLLHARLGFGGRRRLATAERDVADVEPNAHRRRRRLRDRRRAAERDRHWVLRAAAAGDGARS